METESKLRLADVFVSITDPRQAGKVAHDLVELLVVAVNAVLVGADTFVEIELWARERIDWLSRYLRLENGIHSGTKHLPWVCEICAGDNPRQPGRGGEGPSLLLGIRSTNLSENERVA